VYEIHTPEKRKILIPNTYSNKKDLEGAQAVLGRKTTFKFVTTKV
jgi:hypothetical protein